MKSATLAACAGLVLAGSAWFGSAAALGASSGPVGLSAATLAPAVSMMSMAEEAPRAFNPARACVQAFSKDICDSYLDPGQLFTDGCPGTDCKTAYVQSARLGLRLRHNQQGCASGPEEGRCDEVREKDGRLDARVNITLRANEPCALRGFFEGRWKLQADDGTVYDGTVTGTIGVGTHRGYECQTIPGRDCERCLDVEFLPEHGVWRIGVEASFVGRQAIPGDQHTLNFTMSGDFFAKGDEQGPYNLAGEWKFDGTADGAHTIYCE